MYVYTTQTQNNSGFTPLHWRWTYCSATKMNQWEASDAATLIDWCRHNSSSPRIAQCITFHCTFAYQKGDTSAISEKGNLGAIKNAISIRIRKSKEWFWSQITEVNDQIRDDSKCAPWAQLYKNKFTSGLGQRSFNVNVKTGQWWPKNVLFYAFKAIFTNCYTKFLNEFAPCWTEICGIQPIGCTSKS